MPKRNIYRDGARVYKHGRQFLHHVVPAVLKPAHSLWHEVIGFIFVAMAIIFLLSGFRAIRQFDGSAGAVARIGLLGVAVCVLGGYGVSSFLRARKISRS